MPDPIKLYKELKEYKDVDGNVQDLIPKYKTEQEFTTALGDRNYRQKLHQYLSANELLPDGAESYVQFEKDVMGGIVSKPQAKPKAVEQPIEPEQDFAFQELPTVEPTQPVADNEVSVGAVDGFLNAIDRGINQGEIADLLALGQTPTPEQIKQIARLTREQQQMPASDAYNRFNSAESFGDAISALKGNVLEIGTQLVTESLTALLRHGYIRAGVGAAAGSVVPGAGTALGALAGMTVAGYNVELASSILESFADAGVDVSNEDDLLKAFSDEETLNKARVFANKRAVPIAIFDMFSMGIGGKLLAKPAKNALVKAAQLGGEALIQSGIAAGGETAAQLISGQKINPTSILAEALGELGAGAPDIAVGSIINKKKSNEDIRRDVSSVDVPPEVFDDLVDISESAGEIDEIQSAEIKEEFAKATASKTKIPEELRSNPEIVSLITDKDDLVQQIETLSQKKGEVDPAFHDKIDQAITQLEEQGKAIEAQIKELSNPTTNTDQPSLTPEANVVLTEGVTEKVTERAEGVSLGELKGKAVRYKGKSGILSIDEGGKITIDTGNTVYEIDGSSEDATSDFGIRVPTLQSIKIVDNENANIDGVNYKVETDNKGNVVSLIGENGKEVKDNNTLVEVEIKRNQTVDNSDVADRIQSNPTELITTINTVSPISIEPITFVLNENMNSTIDSAIDRLFDGENITEQEQLQIEIYTEDAVERLEQLKARMPEMAESVDRTINGIYAIDDLLNQTKKYGKNNKNSGSKKEDSKRKVVSKNPVQQPTSRGKEAGTGKPVENPAVEVEQFPKNPKSEETNKPITAKAKSGSLYTRQSNGTWKSERGVVATSPKLIESLNEQVKDLVLGFDSRDSQKSTKPAEPKSQKTGETTTKTKETKQGFTETKDLNRMYKEVKTKYGIKEGGKIIDTALRLVDTTKNTIVEIRSNGVVVKEEGKFLFKPFTKAEGNSKKTILGKPMDISDQFESPKSETKAEAGSVGVGGDVEVFHLVENEGLWKATTKSYRGRDTGNWVYSRLDKKQTNEYNKLRDAADNYGTKEQAEENLKKLKDFERENKEAFQEAKKAIDGLKQEEERQSEENKKQQKIIDETSKELDRLSDKDFDKLVELIDEKRRQTLEQRFGDRVERRTLFRTPISESYHAAKADGSNPELVKAVEQSLKETTKVEPKQEKREPNPKPKSEPKSKEQELKDELDSALIVDTDLQFSRSDTKKDSPLYVDKSSTVKHSLSPMLVNQIAEAEKEGNRPKLISLRVIKALLPTFRAAGITLKLHPDGDSMMAAQRQANDFGTAAKGFYNPKTKEIHLNLESLTTDTPIHEILHPIVGMAMKAKPDVVKNWVESIKSDPIMGKDLAEFIERNYGKEKPDIKEAELVVTYVGQRVAEILSADPKNQESRENTAETKKSLYKKLIQKVKDLLNDLGIGLYKKDIIGEIGNETSVSDLAYTIADIISRRGVIQFQPSQNGNMQKQVDAWHGTPHQLKGGKFSTEFIGTGEGAQAFGWGLYFTDIKSIAENYAETLSDTLYTLKGSKRSVTLPRLFQSGLVPAKVYDIVFDIASNQKTVTKNSILSTLDKKINSAGLFSRYSKENLIETKKFVEDSIEEVIPNQRNLVKATIHKGKTPDQYNWLEWDKPLTQSQKDLIKQKLQEDKHWIVDNDRPLGDGTLGVDGQMVYQSLNTLFGSPKDASLFLLKTGIDGIKYPAESLARGTTSDNARGFNYVVFDENAITVEEQIQFSRDDNFKSWVEGSVNKLFDLRPDMYGNKEYVNSRIEGIYEWLKEKGKDLSKADKSLIAARMKEKFGIVDDTIIEAQTKSKATFNNQKAERVAADLNIPVDNKYVKDTLKGAIQTAMDADLDPNVILDNVNQGKTSLSKDEYLTLVALWSDTKLSLGALEQRVQLGLATPQDLRLMEEFLNKMEEINNALVSARSTAGFILGTGSHILPLPKARSAQEIADLYNKAAGMAATEETRKLTQQLAEKLAKLEAEHKAEIENADARAKEYEQKLNELSTRISTEEIKAKKINPSRVKNKKDLFEYVKTMSKSVILKSKEDGDTDSKADPDKVRREVLLGAVKVAIESGTDHKDLTAITDAVNGLIEELNAELAKSEETRDQKINPTNTQEIIATLLPVKKANIDNAKTKVNKAINELRTEAKRLNILENLLNGIYKPQTGTKPNATQIKDIIDKIRLAAYKAETSESAKAEINELLSKVDANVIDWVNTGSMDAISRAIEAVRSISTRKGKGKMNEADKESAIAKDTKKWEDYKAAIDTYAKDPDKGASDILDLVATMDILPKKRESEYSKKLQARQTKLRKLRENLRRVAEAAHKKVNSSWIEKAGAKADDVIFNFFRSLKVTGDISAIFTNAYLGNMKLLFEAFAERDMAKAKVIQKAFVDAWGAFKAGLSNREDVALAHYEALQGMNGDIYEHLYGLKLSHPFDPELSEEYFKSNFAAKMGQQMGKAKFNIIQASEAHMTTYLNTIRYSLFNTFYEANPTASKEELQNFAEIVNLLTGTTNKPVNGLMTRLFLAPKYMISRWKVLASTFYDKKDTTHAIQQAVGTALVLPLLIAAGAALLSGDDEPLISFDFDYLSQHFMKLKIGDNYIQSVPALTNIVQLVMQTLLVIMHANEADLTDLEKSNAYLKGGKGSYSLTYPAWQYLNQRFNPAVGVFTTLATKRDFKGDVYAPGWEGKVDMAIDVFAPISVGSFFENMVNPKDDPNYIERMQPLLEAMGVPIVNYQNAAMHKDVQEIFKKADWAVSSKARTPESSWTYSHEYFRDAYKDELKHRLGLAILALKKDDPEKTFTYKQLDKLLGDVKGNRVGYALSDERSMPIDKYLREKYIRRYGEEDLKTYVKNAKFEMEKKEKEKKEHRSK